ncbi:hypothetical protein GW17_00044851 [Ensete ventricosum]|nr:hypothetical protein GW17_00044851 [Ensete ventricosum]
MMRGGHRRAPDPITRDRAEDPSLCILPLRWQSPPIGERQQHAATPVSPVAVRWQRHSFRAPSVLVRDRAGAVPVDRRPGAWERPGSGTTGGGGALLHPCYTTSDVPRRQNRRIRAPAVGIERLKAASDLHCRLWQGEDIRERARSRRPALRFWARGRATTGVLASGQGPYQSWKLEASLDETKTEKPSSRSAPTAKSRSKRGGRRSSRLRRSPGCHLHRRSFLCSSSPSHLSHNVGDLDSAVSPPASTLYPLIPVEGRKSSIHISKSGSPNRSSQCLAGEPLDEEFHLRVNVLLAEGPKAELICLP